MFTIDGHTSQASSHSYVLESYPPRHSHRTAISSEIPRKSGGVSARWCPLMQQIAFLQPPTTRQDNNRTPFPKKGILHFIAHDSIIRVFYFILFYGMIYFRSSSTLLYTPQHISRPFPPRGNLLQYDTTRNHKSCHITKPCKSIHPSIQSTQINSLAHLFTQNHNHSLAYLNLTTLSHHTAEAATT